MELMFVRAAERLLAVAIGGLAIWLGYQLFRAVRATGEGNAEVRLPGDITVMVSRVAPGVFFALFGAAVVAVSLAFPVKYSESQQRVAGGEILHSLEASGVGEGAVRAPSEAARESERLRVRRHLRFLNDLPYAARLSDAERRPLEEGLREVKLYLMRQVWSEEWGHFEDFQLWAEGYASPGAEVAVAARGLFEAGEGESR